MTRGTTPPQSWEYAQSVLGRAEIFGGAPVTDPSQLQLASILPDLSNIPAWVWWTGGAVLVGALVLRRD